MDKEVFVVLHESGNITYLDGVYMWVQVPGALYERGLVNGGKVKVERRLRSEKFLESRRVNTDYGQPPFDQPKNSGSNNS